MSKYSLAASDASGSVSIEAVLNKLGGIEGARMFLRGELEVREVVRHWVREGGLYYMTVISDGTTGEEWIARLREKGFDLSQRAKQLLRSNAFEPTNGKVYRVAVLPGQLFSCKNRTTGKIWANAAMRGFSKPGLEVACLLREHLTDDDLKAMGLAWLSVMHEPVEVPCGGPFNLGLSRFGAGHRLSGDYGRPRDWWDRDRGFAYVDAQA